MIKSRTMMSEDIPELKSAIDNDTFHPGTWTVESFLGDGKDWFEVFEDDKSSIAFVRYGLESETRVRIFTIWKDFSDSRRNARTIVIGINQLVKKLNGSQFTELVFSTSNPALAGFCTKVLGFVDIGDGDYVKSLKKEQGI